MRYHRNESTQESWEFVSTARSTADTTKSFVVLRPDRGPDVLVPEDTFRAEYQLVSGKGSVSTEVVKETLASIRQISAIRFVGLPFFLGASAAMAKAYTIEPWSGMPMFAWFGLGLALVGVSFEILLSRNLKCWWEALRELDQAAAWKPLFAARNLFFLWWIRLVLLAPYLGMVFYWVYVLRGADDGVRWATGASILCFLVAWGAWVSTRLRWPRQTR